MPRGLATALTTGPVSTSDRTTAAAAAARITIASVTSSCCGRSFQIGRPSGVS